MQQAKIDIQTHGFLKSLPFFDGLPEEDMKALLQASIIRNFDKHRNLFHQGDRADQLLIIIDGWVKLYRHTTEGEECVIAIFTRGDILGEAAIIMGASYPFSAETAEETKFIEIPGQILRERAAQNHKIMSRIMSSMSRELRNVQMENEHLAIMSAPQRVGCLLLQLSSGLLGKGASFPFPYDKSLAASRLGMKAETFSRALAQLKPLGVTVKGPEVTIKDFSNLVEYVCNHCSSLPGECRGSRNESCENTECKSRTAN